MRGILFIFYFSIIITSKELTKKVCRTQKESLSKRNKHKKLSWFRHRYSQNYSRDYVGLKEKLPQLIDDHGSSSIE